MITPVGAQPPKEKESAWDKISKVMGFASTAMGIGQGVSNMLAPAPPTAVAPAPAEPPAVPVGNMMQRRLFGRVGNYRP